ncbi:SMI1/KNR4 family protein [Pseudomonas delhiensis]|uniref:SMI1/KNR4 family protein n=2 Tax=Pseudomonas TaxID=286 RepID=UPI00315A220F
MSALKFYKSGPSISLPDIELLEKIVNHSLPEDFKQFYLTHNGGIPDRDWWDSDDNYDPVRVKRFKIIARTNEAYSNDTKYLDALYTTMTKKVVPETLLPFAIDDGGNFFCLDLTENNICLYAIDSFDNNISPESNHANAYRWLTGSFENFINNLKHESEIYI